MILTDTHTHLYLEDFENDINDVIENAKSYNVQRFFLPNIDSSTIEQVNNLVEKYPNMCFPMMGLHPTSVKENWEGELEIMKNELFENKGKYVAIGEIGIDLYWDKSFKEEQIEVFRTQIQWAKILKLPIVIHCRDSFEEIFKVLDEENDDALKGIFHCFTGDASQASKILNYGGFKLGIGGVVTFKNSKLDQAIKHLNLGDIVLETDSPYLTPTPYRGKRNESAYLIYIAEKLAALYNVKLDEVAEITTYNSKEIFGV